MKLLIEKHKEGCSGKSLRSNSRSGRISDKTAFLSAESEGFTTAEVHKTFRYQPRHY
jgi:hypothetical protein